MDFRSILEEKMTDSLSEKPVQDTFSATLDPAHLAFLLGKIEIRRFRKPAPMPRKAAPRPRPRVAGTPHLLTERQKSAVQWFADRGERLEADFTAPELKKAFRRLALRVHPDVAGGSAAEFMELQRASAELRSIFSKAQTP